MEQFFPLQKTPQKRALVLGGGGAKGSYEAGVVQALDQMNATFDIVTGTSVGAICGSLYIQQSSQVINQWISTIGTDGVADNLFIFPNQYQIDVKANPSFNGFMDLFTKNGPSIEPLMENLKRIFDYKKFMASETDFACLSYNLTQNKPQPFYRKDMTEEDVLYKIIASTAYFPAFNPVFLNGDYLIDGGYVQTVPIDLAQDMGAELILAVDLDQPGVPNPFVEDANKKIIRPLLQLDYFLDFRPDDIERQIKQGYLETLKYFSQAPGYLYTFYPDDWDHMVHLEEFCMAALVKTGKVALIEQLPEVLDRVYTFLLGYVPQPLTNAYSERFIFGRILEVLGLIAGVDLYKQVHFKDFFHEIMEKFEEFTGNPNKVSDYLQPHAMELKGLRDLIVFFKTALVSFGDVLPAQFDAIKEKFILPYYLAYGWILLERFRIFIYL